MFKSECSPGFTASGVLISGWSHCWQVYLAPGPHTYAPTTMPAPFEAYGPDVEFVLEKCSLRNTISSQSSRNSKEKSQNSKVCRDIKDCREYTLVGAKREQECIPLVFKNYATIFGATRNKRLALSTKKRKAAMQEESSEEEAEADQEQDMDAKSAKSEGSESSEESSESEEEEKEESEEDEEEEEEEEED